MLGYFFCKILGGVQEEKKKMSVIVAYNRIKKSVGRAEKGKEKVCALIKLIEEYNI